MPLPPDLNQAIATIGGGRIALIIGAGCSVEAPTGVPVARTCSLELHDQLVADGVLAAGDCAQPEDLSVLADAVFAKTNSQLALVSRMRDRYNLHARPANDGYLIAAALLCENAIAAIVTLNFDVALTSAISELSCADVVGIIEGPAHLPQQKGRNVYYLHRNANAVDAEVWVLRSRAIEAEWQGHWQQPITQNVLIKPCVVFAGLGTPVTVLMESVSLMRAAIPGGSRLFQVDPAPSAGSQFFQALNLPEADYIQLGWSEFMRQFSDRLMREHGSKLSTAATQKANDDGLTQEDLTTVLEQLRVHGIVRSGRIRAMWLLDEKKPYLAFETNISPLIADLLLSLALVARVSGTVVTIGDDGIVEFRRAGAVIAAIIVASGSGHLKMPSIEARINKRKYWWRGRGIQPTAALVAGTSEIRQAISPPADVLRGELKERNLVDGSSGISLFHIDDLRQNLANVTHLVA